MSVNLLPSSLLPSPGVQKIIKVVRNMTTISIVSLIVLIVGFSAIYAYNYRTINNLNTDKDELSMRVGNLENTEQSLYLLRDRLNKIQKVQTAPNLANSLDEAKEIVSFIPQDVTLEFMDVEPTGIKYGVSALSSEVISNFLSNLETSGIFSKIQMNAFNFNQSVGFTADFTVNQ